MNIIDFINDIYTWQLTAGRSIGDTKLSINNLSFLQSEVNELKEAIQNSDKVEIADAIIDTFWTALNVGHSEGISPETLLKYAEAISKSNWSKFCNTEEEAILTVDSYSNGTHPDKLNKNINTYYKFVNNVYVILRMEDDKIMKNINYKNTSYYLNNEV